MERVVQCYISSKRSRRNPILVLANSCEADESIRSNETLLHRREFEFEFEFERGDEELTDRLRSRDWLWSNKVAADLRKPNIVGRKKLCCFQRFTAKEGEKGLKIQFPNRR